MELKFMAPENDTNKNVKSFKYTTNEAIKKFIAVTTDT